MFSETFHEDNLMEIRGIGPARQLWLRKNLHIHTFEDLANLSVVEVMERLKADRQITSQSEVEEWIEQAKRLVPSNVIAQERAWTPIASFVVEFQVQEDQYRTVVHHMETDSGTQWQGIERTQLANWMVEHLSPSTGDLPITALSVTDFQVIQAGQVVYSKKALPDHKQFLGFLHTDEPFGLQVWFEMPNEGSYQMDCSAEDMETHTALSLASLLPCEMEAEHAYTAQLPMLQLGHGLYRFHLVIRDSESLCQPLTYDSPIAQVI